MNINLKGLSSNNLKLASSKRLINISDKENKKITIESLKRDQNKIIQNKILKS